MPPDKEKRNPRTTNQPLEILINYLEKHKIMLNLKTHPLKTDEVKAAWEELTIAINNTKKGAKKSVDEWKRFLVTWKSKTKSKARQLKCEQKGTGGGPPTATNLSEYEERLMNLIGWNTVEGCDLVAAELSPEDLLLPDVQLISEKETNDMDSLSAQEIFNADIDVSEVLNSGNNEIYEILESNKVTKTNSEKPRYATPLKSKKTNKSPHKKTSQSSTKTLEHAAQLYANSAQLFASSIDKLASAITLYAEAMVKTAQIRNKMCEKCAETE